LVDLALRTPAVPRSRKAALEHLHKDFGDLELVLGDQATRERLAALPFGVVLAVLQDDRTRVAHESTAVAAAGLWLAEHREATPEMRRALAGEMRLAAMAPSFLALQLPATPWFADAVPAAELQLATAVVLGAAEGAKQRGEALSARADLVQWRGWLKSARPKSALNDLVLELCLTEARVKELLQAASTGNVQTVLSLKHLWAGYSWQLGMKPKRLAEAFSLEAWVVTDSTAIAGGAPRSFVTATIRAGAGRRGSHDPYYYHHHGHAATSTVFAGKGAAGAEMLEVEDWEEEDLGGEVRVQVIVEELT
jgi:hypothetical protein